MDFPPRTIKSILQIDITNIRDARFITTFNEQLKQPIHNVAKFILVELLKRQGLLISEEILAARLGIDLKRSADWNTFLERILSSIKYVGVFSDYWMRWWMPLLEKWWNSVSPNNYLRSLSAIERVEIIKKETGFNNLIPIEKSEKSSSNTFWTICKGSHIPIDTIDGLILVNQDNLYPWQDKEYVSIDEVLAEENKDEWIDVATSEKMRLEKLKNIHGNVVRVRK